MENSDWFFFLIRINLLKSYQNTSAKKNAFLSLWNTWLCFDTCKICMIIYFNKDWLLTKLNMMLKNEENIKVYYLCIILFMYYIMLIMCYFNTYICEILRKKLMVFISMKSSNAWGTKCNNCNFKCFRPRLLYTLY